MLNIALLQFSPSFGRVQENLKLVLEMLNHVRNGSLVVLPEMWQCGFDYENLQKHAEMTEDVIEEICKISKERHLTVVGTYPMKEDRGIYNSAVLVNRGNVLGKRAKIKLFPLYEEQRYFLSGSENPIFEVEGLKVGVLVCFELRFPYLSWSLREAHILLVPSMWGASRREHLITLSRARAIENQSFLALCNAWGKVGNENYAGASGIYSPWGEALAFSEKGTCIMQVEIDPKEVEEIRKLLPIEH